MQFKWMYFKSVLHFRSFCSCITIYISPWWCVMFLFFFPPNPMAIQKAVTSCMHDPDSPVNIWPFKWCFSFVPQKTPVIPVETFFFLAAICWFWFLLILLMIFFYLQWFGTHDRWTKNISDDHRMQETEWKMTYRYHYLLHALIYFLLRDYFVLNFYF